MSGIWGIVAAIGLGTIAIKAAGPVLLGSRPLPPPVRAVVALLAPALLAALVATATLGEAQSLVVDSRVIGIGAAALALALRAPMLAVVLVAAAAAAVARAAGIG